MASLAVLPSTLHPLWISYSLLDVQSNNDVSDPSQSTADIPGGMSATSTYAHVMV